MNRKRRLLLSSITLITFCLAMVSISLPNSISFSTNQRVKTSSISESEDFSAESHGTKGLDIEFIDEYHGYGSGYYCDQYISDGPFGDHTKVLIMRDAQGGLNTWSVHSLENSYSVGLIEFSLWFASGSSCTNPHYHYIKFRDTSNVVAFQLRFDLYSNKAYYYTGSTWGLIATLTEAEWYKYTIYFDIDSSKYDIEIIKETNSAVMGTISDADYQNNVPIEEIYLGTTVSHYSGNTRWDDFLITADTNYYLESQLYTDISAVNIQKGYDYTGDGNVNSLDDLKYIDAIKYEIEGEWDSYYSEYQIEVYFLFGADLSIFALDYYDLFLFLKIDGIDVPGSNFELQAYSTYDWVTVTTISNSMVSLNPKFLERTTELRIIGSSLEEPIIKIDQMRIVIAHDGNIGPTFQFESDITGYEMLYKNPSSGYVEDNLWWEDDDGEEIGHEDLNSAFWVGTSALVESQFRIFLGTQSTGTITNIHSGYIESKYRYTNVGWSVAGWPPSGGYSYTYIKDHDADEWIHTHNRPYTGVLEGDTFMVDTWSINENEADKYIILDSSSTYYFDLRYRTYAWVDWWFMGSQYAYSKHYIDEVNTLFEIEGYGFENYEYPELTVDRMTDYNFEINSNGKYLSSSIESVEFLVQNDTYYSEWQTVDKVGGEWQLELDRYDYENGVYNVWIRATDEHGFSSYDCYSLEIEHKDSPLYWVGPVEGETIYFNCTTIETSDAIFDMYVYIDDEYFDTEIKFYIDNGFGDRVDRTPPGGLVSGNNSINLEPYNDSVNGNITAIIEGTDIFGVTHSFGRNFIFRKMISAETIEFDHGVQFIGNELYAIIYDPNGDRSWASFRNTEYYSHTWEFDWSFNVGVGIDIKVKITPDSIFTWGMYYNFNFEYLHEDIVKIESMDITEITSTTSWSATSSSTGPGRGDTYWGEAIYVPYYTSAISAEFWGAEGSPEYINPTLHYGMNFTGQVIGGPGEVPNEWLEENYILQAEENGGEIPDDADITWESDDDNGLGNWTVTGGGRDLQHTHSDKASYTKTDTYEFDVDFGLYLGIVTVSLGRKRTVSESVENMVALTRTYHMEDFDYYDDVEQGDIITNRIGIDNRFGTYIFETIEEACFTSDPWEYNTYDWRPPVIGEPEIELDSNDDGEAPCADDEPIVIVDIEDESGIQSAYIKYSTSGGLVWNTAPLIEYPADPGTWEGHIPSFPEGTTVLWYIEVIDLFENIKNKTDGWGDPFSYIIINSAPYVTLLTPEDSSTHYDTVYISWFAEDLDNDDLHFTLSYTLNGVTKYLIESGLTGNSYEWDISGLGSMDVLIIVEVFDGTVTTEDRNEYVVYLNP